MQEGDGGAKKKVTHLFDSRERWMETDIIPALPTETYKSSPTVLALWEKRREIWVIGVAVFTTEKMG